MTIRETRTQCGFSNLGSSETPEISGSDDTGPIKERLESDEKNLLKSFSHMANESNYLLVGAYNFHDWSTNIYDDSSSSEDISF